MVDESIEGRKPRQTAAKKAHGKSSPQVPRTIDPEEGILNEQEQGACDGHFLGLDSLHLPERNG